MGFDNHIFLEYIGKGIPIVLSTGMSDLFEIKKAVRVIKNR